MTATTQPGITLDEQIAFAQSLCAELDNREAPAILASLIRLREIEGCIISAAPSVEYDHATRLHTPTATVRFASSKKENDPDSADWKGRDRYIDRLLRGKP